MLKKLALSALIFTSSLFAADEVVNVYSSRHYDTDKQLFKMFEEKTGIKVNALQAKASALIRKMELEGEKSKADVLVTVDAGRLYHAKQKNLFQAIDSEYLTKNIKANLRDKDNQWFAITKRARVLAYSLDSGLEKELSTYEDLANPKFKGKIMVRTSNNIYNQSLLAAMIAHHGEEYAIKWAKGVVANMAKKPKGNDRYQIKAIANGIGSLAIVNTYYVGKMVENKEASQRESAAKVKMFFPKFENGGTHVNVSGAGVAKYAKNKENAIKFIEFMVSKEAQALLSKGNYEYPVLEGVQPSKLVGSWGKLKDDNISMNVLGEKNKDAVKAFDIAGWK